MRHKIVATSGESPCEGPKSRIDSLDPGETRPSEVRDSPSWAGVEPARPPSQHQKHQHITFLVSAPTVFCKFSGRFLITPWHDPQRPSIKTSGCIPPNDWVRRGAEPCSRLDPSLHCTITSHVTRHVASTATCRDTRDHHVTLRPRVVTHVTTTSHSH